MYGLDMWVWAQRHSPSLPDPMAPITLGGQMRSPGGHHKADGAPGSGC